MGILVKSPDGNDVTDVIIDDITTSKQLATALRCYREELWRSCSDVINKSKGLEANLKRLSFQLTEKNDALWMNKNVSGDAVNSDFEASRVTSSILTRNKSTLRGVLADVIEVRGDVTMLKMRVRAAVLF